MKKLYLILVLSFFHLHSEVVKQLSDATFAPSDYLITTKKIEFKQFPDAYNPSIYKTDQGIILAFRYCPDRRKFWINQCVFVLLDKSFNPISKPQIISFRPTDLYPPYFQDCKLFTFKGKLYGIYSDIGDFKFPSDVNFNPFRREKEYIHIAEIKVIGDKFETMPPLRLTYPKNPNPQRREKNWIPFEWQGKLYLSYYLFPHEVLEANLSTGVCSRVYLTKSDHPWEFGQIRGTTPAQLFPESKKLKQDFEYLAFFHSSIFAKNKKLNKNNERGSRIYFMGAYTFSAKPPFEITRASAKPIIATGMYDAPNKGIRSPVVVFPGGYVIVGDSIFVSYGKNDREMWIAKIPKKSVLHSLVPVTPIKEKASARVLE